VHTFSTHLAGRLNYGKGERDMILMRHEVTVRWPDNRRELKGINMVSPVSIVNSRLCNVPKTDDIVPCLI
jgi:hypothetical protein